MVAGGHYRLIISLDRAHKVVLGSLHAATGRHSEDTLVVKIYLLCETVSVLPCTVVIDGHCKGFGLIFKTNKGVGQVPSSDFTEALSVRAPLGPDLPPVICKARDIYLLCLGLPVRLRGQRVDEYSISVEVIFESVKVTQRVKVLLIDILQIENAHAIASS